MAALMDMGGKQLARKRNTWNGFWAQLQTEHLFTTVPGQAEYQLPEDFYDVVDGTLWDRNQYRQMRGSLSPQSWQALKSSLVETVSISPLFRLRSSSSRNARSIWLDPVPSYARELVLEYGSLNWVIDETTQTRKRSITADTDTFVFDDDLMQMDLLWRWKHSRGLPWQVEYSMFESERDRRWASDAGAQVINLGSTNAAEYPNVPDSGFGQVL